MKINLDKIKITCSCGGKTKKIETEWKGIKCRAWKCSKCKEEILHPSDAQKAMEIIKAKEKRELSVKIRTIGKSTTITVPHTLVNLFGINKERIAEWDVPVVFDRNRFSIELHK